MLDNHGRSSKRCSKCQIDKTIEEYNVNRTYGSGRDARCKECLREYQRHLQSTPIYRAKLKEWTKRGKLKCRYGLTEERYAEILASQNGVCALCWKPPSGTLRQTRLHVDHDHETGQIRGLLCNACNRALGQLGDNAEGIMNTLNYLLKDI